MQQASATPRSRTTRAPRLGPCPSAPRRVRDRAHGAAPCRVGAHRHPVPLCRAASAYRRALDLADRACRARVSVHDPVRDPVRDPGTANPHAGAPFPLGGGTCAVLHPSSGCDLLRGPGGMTSATRVPAGCSCDPTGVHVRGCVRRDPCVDSRCLLCAVAWTAPLPARPRGCAPCTLRCALAPRCPGRTRKPGPRSLPGSAHPYFSPQLRGRRGKRGCRTWRRGRW